MWRWPMTHGYSGSPMVVGDKEPGWSAVCDGWSADRRLPGAPRVMGAQMNKSMVVAIGHRPSPIAHRPSPIAHGPWSRTTDVGGSCSSGRRERPANRRHARTGEQGLIISASVRQCVSAGPRERFSNGRRNVSRDSSICPPGSGPDKLDCSVSGDIAVGYDDPIFGRAPGGSTPGWS